MPDTTLNDLVLAEAAAGTLTERVSTLPSIPPLQGDDLVNLKKTIMPMKAWIDARQGASGSVLDKALTLRDLVDAGIFNIKYPGGALGGTTSPTVMTPADAVYLDPRPYYTTPPTPTNLVTAAAFRNVILTWDLVNYQNHAYTEVWRAGTNALGSAAKIATAQSGIYTDGTALVGATYYYWVRDVNVAGAVGAYNAVGGTSAALLTIAGTDLGPLIVDAANLATGAVTATKIGALAVGTAAIQTGAITNALIGNLAVDTANIAALAVSTAKIALAAVDNAQIANLAVDNAKIANLAVTTGKIANLAVDTLQIAGQAVTIPASSFVAGPISYSLATLTTMASVTFTSTGAPILILAGATLATTTGGGAGTYDNELSIYRGSTLLTTYRMPADIATSAGATYATSLALPPFQDTPGAGSVTYSVRITSTYVTGPTYTSQTYGKASIFCIETKK